MGGMGSVCPVGSLDGDSDIDDGTLVRALSSVPGTLGLDDKLNRLEILKSGMVEQHAGTTVATIAGMSTYDAFVRAYIYQPGAKAISHQGESFVKMGLMTSYEAANWVTTQRNRLLIAVRDSRNTPLGKAISEYLKPREKLPQLPDLVKIHETRTPGSNKDEIYRAIIKSGASTRASVNKLAATLRWTGPVIVAVDVAFSGYLIYTAPPQERGRVATQQVGQTLGAVGGTWAGAKAGCGLGASVGVWFEGIGAIPGCAIGAIVGAGGGGYAGSVVGHKAGDILWSEVNTMFEWE